jgi:pimeloyl-ACP methyl ester carboxylesterase
MHTAVLVHGGFHGGWCWRGVAARLRSAGWDVHTPTLSGVGDRAHLASPEIGLETHIRDVTSLIEFEDLDDVLLCGHSAAGVVVTAVADRLAARIRHVVHLDAMVPRDGESFVDVVGEDSGLPGILRDQAAAGGDGWLVPPAPLFTAATLGITESATAAWLDRRLTKHPLAGLTDKVSLSGAVDALPKTYVRCQGLAVPVLDKLAATLETQPLWRVQRWDSGHDVMITEPARVVALLDDIQALGGDRSRAAGGTR